MLEFIKGFFAENSPYSMTRLNLFWSGIVVNAMCITTLIMYFYSEGKWDFTSQCAILSSLLLGTSMSGKIIQKKQENASNNS